MSGFTILEVSLVLILISIYLNQTVAIHSKEQQIITRDIFYILKTAQVKAMAWNTRVCVCNFQKNKCVDNWNKILNLIVYIDKKKNNHVDKEDIIISKFKINAKKFIIKHNIRKFIYFNKEKSSGNTITIKGIREKQESSIIITKSGRIRTTGKI